jgi:hypothetical protein
MGLDDLLVLQGKCKTDPESYHDDFLMRLRHYKSLLVRASARVHGTASLQRRLRGCSAACARGTWAAWRAPCALRRAWRSAPRVRARRAMPAADSRRCRRCAPLPPRRCAQAIFALSPSAEYKEFSDLVNFLAQARPARGGAAAPARASRRP